MAYASARTLLPGSDQADFQTFAAQFNKHYSTTGQMNQRMNVWLQNKATVDQLNDQNSGTGVIFALNETGDLTDGEFRQMQGLTVPLGTELPTNDKMGSSENNNQDNRNGMGLGNGIGTGFKTDQSINWVDQGKVHSVKNQGGCGSCWAFAATLVQESM